MPGTDRRLDPITKDYVDNGRGGWETTTTVATALHHQLLGELNQWPGDPEAGSLLHTLRRLKSSAKTLDQALELLRQAVQPFIDRGLAKDLVLKIEKNQHGPLSFRASVHDVQYGVLDLTPLLPIGA